MNELTNLINNYLVQNPHIYHEGKSDFLENKLNKFLHNLVSFECPDMYSKIKNNVLILEHFQFDCSNENRHGMSGISTENITNIKIENQLERETLYSISYEQTTDNYIKNFKKHFDSHHKKIKFYEQNLSSKKILTNTDNLTVGFFIENKLPPYCFESEINNELILLFTKEFLDEFESSTLDFVLFGGLFNQKNILFYIDKNTISAYRKKQISLKNITLCDMNEIIWNSKITF